MRRNELFTSTALESADSAQTLNSDDTKVICNTEMTKTESKLDLPDNCKSEFLKAMKIGYYKEFYKQGLITAEQLEQLIAMQEKKSEALAA